MNKLILAILLSLPTTYAYAEEVTTMPTLTLSVPTQRGVSDEAAARIDAKVDAEVKAKVAAMEAKWESDCQASPACMKARKRAAFATKMNQMGITDGLRAYNLNREVDALIHTATDSARRNGMLVE